MNAKIIQDYANHEGELAPQSVRVIARNLLHGPGIETVFFDFKGRVVQELPEEGGYMACGNHLGHAIYRFLGKEVK